MWREDLRLQLASPNIFTSSTFLQFDRLIAAGSSDGRVHLFDLRMGNKGQVGIVGEQCEQSFHSLVFSESITKIAAHPIHPILVTAGVDAYLNMSSYFNLKTIHITNISIDIEEEDLLDFLQQFGEVKSLLFKPNVEDRITFADVEFKTYESA
ncbi:MAG: hypothetical protein EZS28_047643, partial [Streblomastix strix]